MIRSVKFGAFMPSKDNPIWFDAKQGGTRDGGIVYGLLKDLAFAARLLKAAQVYHLRVRNFDRTDALSAGCEREKPILIIMDWDGLEAECFKTLKQLGENVDFKKVPTIGFISQSKRAVREEAQRAGCDRVYMKTEFIHSLNDILMRYAL